MSIMQLDSKSVVQWWENASDLTKFITLKWSLKIGNYSVLKDKDIENFSVEDGKLIIAPEDYCKLDLKHNNSWLLKRLRKNLKEIPYDERNLWLDEAERCVMNFPKDILDLSELSHFFTIGIDLYSKSFGRYRSHYPSAEQAKLEELKARELPLWSKEDTKDIKVIRGNFIKIPENIVGFENIESINVKCLDDFSQGLYHFKKLKKIIVVDPSNLSEEDKVKFKEFKQQLEEKNNPKAKVIEELSVQQEDNKPVEELKPQEFFNNKLDLNTFPEVQWWKNATDFTKLVVINDNLSSVDVISYDEKNGLSANFDFNDVVANQFKIFKMLLRLRDSKYNSSGRYKLNISFFIRKIDNFSVYDFSQLEEYLDIEYYDINYYIMSEHIIDMLSKIKSLKIVQGGFESFPIKLSQVQDLNLKMEEFICPDDLSDFKNLINLDLSNCNKCYLKEVLKLKTLPNLKWLKLPKKLKTNTTKLVEHFGKEVSVDIW